MAAGVARCGHPGFVASLKRGRRSVAPTKMRLVVDAIGIRSIGFLCHSPVLLSGYQQSAFSARLSPTAEC
jgi:hypothetical protein